MGESIGETFMEQTKHHALGPSDQMRRMPQPPLQAPYDAAQPAIPLPDPQTCPRLDVGVYEAIVNRRSLRQYGPTPLALVELSYLLWCTQGVKETFGSVTLRNVPSAGARHAFETYVLANHIDDLRPGVYRFLALEHQLIEIGTGPEWGARITSACFGQGFVLASAATLIWTAVPYRMAWRYGQRAYRYLHLDAGHVCQNLYLSAESIGCGVCAIAAFDDDQLNRLLGLDGESAFAIYVGTVGKTAGASS